jgi:hypothetical protein
LYGRNIRCAHSSFVNPGDRTWPVRPKRHKGHRGHQLTEVTNKFNDTAGIPTRTAASTIEALLYELRSGLSCLADEGARNRLRSCDEAAMRVIAAELLSWRSKNKPWLPPWSEDDVAKLAAIWGALR